MDKLGEDCLCREMPFSLISHLTGGCFFFCPYRFLFEDNILRNRGGAGKKGWRESNLCLHLLNSYCILIFLYLTFTEVLCDGHYLLAVITKTEAVCVHIVYVYECILMCVTNE